MLKRPLPGAMRRMVGIAAVISVIALSSYSVWATQPEVSKETPASDQSSGIFFSSQELVQGEHGVYVATGNVVLKPPPGSPHFEISADRVDAGDDGLTLFEGNVTIKIGNGVVNADRATMAADGTIRMDAARITNLFN